MDIQTPRFTVIKKNRFKPFFETTKELSFEKISS